VAAPERPPGCAGRPRPQRAALWRRMPAAAAGTMRRPGQCSENLSTHGMKHGARQRQPRSRLGQRGCSIARGWEGSGLPSTRQRAAVNPALPCAPLPCSRLQSGLVRRAPQDGQQRLHDARTSGLLPQCRPLPAGRGTTLSVLCTRRSRYAICVHCMCTRSMCKAGLCPALMPVRCQPPNRRERSHRQRSAPPPLLKCILLVTCFAELTHVVAGASGAQAGRSGPRGRARRWRAGARRRPAPRARAPGRRSRPARPRRPATPGGRARPWPPRSMPAGRRPATLAE